MDPESERNVGEREAFWEGLSECVDSFDERERILVLGDLNATMSDEVVEGITGT